MIAGVNVVNAECPYSCDSLDDCRRTMHECIMENTEKSYMGALTLREIYLSKCPEKYPSIYPECDALFQERKNILEQKISQEQQAAQQKQEKQARYTKCRNGDADACFDIGYEEFEECQKYRDCQNPSEALTYFSKSCNLKNKVGCFNTAVILEQNLFFKNPTKAQEYYRKSCNMGYEPACFKVK